MSHELKLIDTHCHLDFPQFDSDRDQVIQNALVSGVCFIINVGSSIKGSLNSVELAKKYDCIYATVGIHPHDADAFNEKARSGLKLLSLMDKVVAIGETGLDYYRNLSERGKQRELFIASINLAAEVNKPLVIHSRQAEDETLAIMKDYHVKRAVIHCFSSDADFLEKCLSMGLNVSFTCNITYKKAENLRECVKRVPLDRIFLETDAPYLPPEGERGKRNSPLGVIMLAREIARIKEADIEEVSRVTTQNAKSFFRLRDNES